MTFAEPLTSIYHSVFIKNPADSPSYTAYIEPLHRNSWYAIAGLIILSAPLFWLVMSNKDDETEPNMHEFTLAKSVVLCFGMMSFARPWSVVPEGWKGKFTFFW